MGRLEPLLHLLGRALPWACAALLLLALLAGCASVPSEPCRSLECMKREQRALLYRSCVRAAQREYAEEVMAGLVDPAAAWDGCRREARRRVP